MSHTYSNRGSAMETIGVMGVLARTRLIAAIASRRVRLRPVNGPEVVTASAGHTISMNFTRSAAIAPGLRNRLSRKPNQSGCGIQRLGGWRPVSGPAGRRR
jgi:hypothetical protein